MTTTNGPDDKKNAPSTIDVWVARTTAILAVVAAISSGRWGACNLQAILEQGKVNDGWSYYQAKSMKQHEAEQTRDLAAALAHDAPANTQLEVLRKHMAAEADREAADKKTQEETTLNLQVSRDKYVESSFWFEISFAVLQLGVILCTIASGAKARVPWTAGMILGIIGLVLLVNGFKRFVPAPKSWYQSTSEQMSNDIKPQASTQP